MFLIKFHLSYVVFLGCSRPASHGGRPGL